MSMRKVQRAIVIHHIMGTDLVCGIEKKSINGIWKTSRLEETIQLLTALENIKMTKNRNWLEN